MSARIIHAGNMVYILLVEFELLELLTEDGHDVLVGDAFLFVVLVVLFHEQGEGVGGLLLRLSRHNPRKKKFACSYVSVILEQILR